MEASSKVARMFREFIKNHDIVLEGRGRSIGAGWKLPITDSMAYFASVFPGIPIRSKIIRWFLTEGMVQASQGRDELAKIVNTILKKNTEQTPSLPSTHGGQPGAAAMGEATSAYDYYEKAEVYPQDLFSPEARKRLPFLNKPICPGGLTVDEYYTNNYEPKFMDIFDVSGDWQRIDIGKTNHILHQKGMPVFRYGGMGGYLQYVEKGEYLPPDEQRGHSDSNQQHGPDLSGGQMDMGPKHEPIASFRGGAVNMQSRKYASVVAQSQAKFNMYAKRIEEGEDVEHVTPEQQALIKKLLEIQDGIKRVEEDAGKYSLARTFGLDRRDKRADFSPESSLHEMLVQAIKVGLKQPFEFREDVFGMPPDEMVRCGILDDYDPSSIRESKDAKHRGRKFITGTYSDLAVEVFMDHIMANYPDFLATTFTPTRVLHHSPKFQEHLENSSVEASEVSEKMQRSFVGGGPGNNRREKLATILNKGFKADEELAEDMQFTAYQLQGIRPQDSITKLDTQLAPFADDAMAAMKQVPQKEEELVYKGYHWIIKNPVSKIEKGDPKKGIPPRPDWSKRDWAAMGYSVTGEDVYDTIKVVKQGNKLYAEVPVSKGEPIQKIKTYGMPTGMMMGGQEVLAGQGLGHLNLNPVHSEEDWNELQQKLLKGEMGEPQVGAKQLRQTKSAIEACVLAAQKYFKGKSEGFAPNIGEILASTGREDLEGSYTGGEAFLSGADLLKWAEEGIWSLSGDRAFQIGYVSQGEVNSRWDQSEAMPHARWLAQQKAEDPDFDDSEYDKPKGIGPLVVKHTSDGDFSNKQLSSLQEELAEIPNHWWDTVKQWAAKGSTPDGNPFTPEMLQAVGENAFLARVDVAARYVADQMHKSYKAWSREKSGDAHGANDDGRSNHYADMPGAKQAASLSQDYEKDPKLLGPEDKRQEFGVEDPNQWKPWKPSHGDTPPQQTTSNRPAWTGKYGSTAPAPEPTPEPTPEPEPRPTTKKVKAEPVARPAWTQKYAQPQQPAQPQPEPQLQQQAPPPQPPPQKKRPAWTKKYEHFTGYDSWKEMVGTYAPYDGTKPKDGCGFNWWGAVGDPLGVSIEGEPIKKGKRNGRRSKKRK